MCLGCLTCGLGVRWSWCPEDIFLRMVSKISWCCSKKEVRLNPQIPVFSSKCYSLLVSDMQLLAVYDIPTFLYIHNDREGAYPCFLAYILALSFMYWWWCSFSLHFHRKFVIFFLFIIAILYVSWIQWSYMMKIIELVLSAYMMALPSKFWVISLNSFM